MKINNQTLLFVSVSKVPGNFGATIFNQLFEKYNLNAIYLPRKAGTPEEVIASIKNLDIVGCSVSMPLKSEIIPYLDALDPTASKTQSVNTIVNRDGKLTGYNTDFYGVQQVISPLSLERVLVYGSGSVTGSVITALKEKEGISISLTARNSEKAAAMAEKYQITHLEDPTEPSEPFDLLINATPASSETDHPLYQTLSHTKGLFDLVVAPEDTPLVTKAKQLGLSTVSGFEMSKYRLQEQFEIYAEISPEMEVIDQIIKASFTKS